MLAERHFWEKLDPGRRAAATRSGKEKCWHGCTEETTGRRGLQYGVSVPRRGRRAALGNGARHPSAGADRMARPPPCHGLRSACSPTRSPGPGRERSLARTPLPCTSAPSGNASPRPCAASASTQPTTSKEWTSPRTPCRALILKESLQHDRARHRRRSVRPHEVQPRRDRQRPRGR